MNTNKSNAARSHRVTSRWFQSLLIFALASQVCFGQTAQEIMERSNQAMDAPIKYRLNTNGKRCTVFQKRLDDGSIALRMEFGSSSSLVRVESKAGSFEIYPKSKSVIDVGFMQSSSNSQISEIVGLAGGSVSTSDGALELISEVEFEGKQCWQLSQTMPDDSRELATKSMPKAAQVKTAKEKRYYIEKQSYKLICVESNSKSGQGIAQLKMDMIERPDEISSDLFLPPADFEMQKPQSIVEYLSVQEQMNSKQMISQMRDDMNAARARSTAMMATTMATATANMNAARNMSSWISYAFPIFMVFMFLFIGATFIWSHRMFAYRMKTMMANSPANTSTSEADFEKAMAAFNVSIWTRFKGAPLVLKAFIIYSLCAIVVSMVLMFFVPASMFAVPMSAFRYVVPLFLIHTALLRKETRRIVHILSFLLVVYAFSEMARVGSMQSISRLRPSAIGVGPQYVALQAVLGVVMPIAWAMLLHSPSMRKWLSAKSETEERTHQIALTDLFYFMVVACLASLASIAIVGMLK